MDKSSRSITQRMAVLCSMSDLPGGRWRVILDDVCQGQDSGTWTHRSLFTYRDFASPPIDDLASLSEAELADFGYTVLVRLFASNGLAT